MEANRGAKEAKEAAKKKEIADQKAAEDKEAGAYTRSLLSST